MAEIMGRAGLNFTMIDFELGPYDMETAGELSHRVSLTSRVSPTGRAYHRDWFAHAFFPSARMTKLGEVQPVR